eukprot:scaffold277074_cov28-Tisochrysis_lutea.AAC.4
MHLNLLAPSRSPGQRPSSQREKKAPRDRQSFQLFAIFIFIWGRDGLPLCDHTQTCHEKRYAAHGTLGTRRTTARTQQLTHKWRRDGERAKVGAG